MVMRAMTMRKLGLMLVGFVCVMAMSTYGMYDARAMRDMQRRVRRGVEHSAQPQGAETHESRVLEFGNGRRATVPLKSVCDVQNGVYFQISCRAFDGLQRDVSAIIRQLLEEKKSDEDARLKLTHELLTINMAYAVMQNRLRELEQQAIGAQQMEDDQELAKG